MNFTGFTPHEVERLGGLVSFDDPVKLPLGVSPNCRNVRFRPTSVSTRWGIQPAMDLASAVSITGLGDLLFKGSTSASDLQIPLVFDSNGNFWRENPVASGALNAITPAIGSLPSGASMQLTYAYNRAYVSFSDLKGTGSATPYALDGGTLVLDPLSYHTTGEPWTPSTAYNVGDVISPTTANSHLYRCTTAGTSGANEPTPWPTGVGSTNNDGSCVWTETTYSAADGAAGNVCAGVHYFVVLFQNRNGYISGMSGAAVFSWTAAGSKKVTISNIPIGPINTKRRIIAFTAANGISAGPFFYIPKADTISVSGVSTSITSTVINDNTSTSATFSFTDDYLANSIEVTSFFRKIKVPFCNSIYFSRTTGRMMYIKPTGNPSAVLISEPTDPETIYGDTGPCQVSENDGEILQAGFEWKGTIYAIKERAGFVISPSSSTPSTWSVTRRWDKVGISGPRAFDVGKEFCILAHRSGVYRFDGQTVGDPVSKEIKELWQQINWDFGHLIWVLIDEENFEVKIGVPFGSSTLPDKVFTLYYGDGWEEPLTVTLYGNVIAAHHARKWSIDDIPANVAIRAERSQSALVAPPTDKNFSNTQILLGSSNPDGNVNMIQPSTYNDNGAAINAIYDTAYTPDPGIQQAGGAVLAVSGKGQAQVSMFGNAYTSEYKMRSIKFESSDQKKDYKAGARGQSERFLLRITNGNQPNSYFEIHRATIYTRTLFGSR